MIEVQSRVKCNCKDKVDKLYSALEEQELEITRLNNRIDKAIEYIPRIIISGKSEHSFNEFAVDFQQTKEGKRLLDILKGSDK